MKRSSFSVASSLALLGYAAANLLGTDGEMWGVSAHHMMHHAKSCSSLFVYEFHLGIVSDVQEQHQTMEERFQVCSAKRLELIREAPPVQISKIGFGPGHFFFWVCFDSRNAASVDES